MKKLIDYISQFGHLNEAEIDYISDKGNYYTLSKDEYFSKTGTVPQHIGFIVEGVIRIGYYDGKGEDITRFFISENMLFADYFKLIENEKASENFQAITDCQLIIFDKQDWLHFSEHIEGWDSILNKMIQAFLQNKLQKKGSLLTEDATQRYLTFLKNFPTLVNRIPLSYVASFLGITRSSLSRIRKKVA